METSKKLKIEDSRLEIRNQSTPRYLFNYIDNSIIE